MAEIKAGEIIAVDGEPHIVVDTFGGRVAGTMPVREYYLHALIDPDNPTQTLADRAVRKAILADMMPVPHCDQCRFWERNSLGDLARGECLLTAGSDGDGCPVAHPESKARAVIGGDEFGVPTLETNESFGCVQFERTA